jgi:uncharacterized membrane protein YcjF (UPF0283 family)
MQPWDEDDRIGVPVASRTAQASRERERPEAPPRPHAQPATGTPVAHAPGSPEPELRAGDPGLGRPPHTPAAVAALTDADRHALRHADEQQALRELAEAEELLASDPGGFRWLGWLAGPLAGAVLVGGAGLLGLLLFSQALTVLANLAAQPPLVQYAGYAGLTLLAGMVLFAAGRLLLLYARLRRNRQLRLAGLSELHARTRLRWLAHAKAAEAQAGLEAYLRAYPLDREKDRAALLRLGLSDAAVRQMTRARDELLDPARFAGTADWFDRFRTGFQVHLDEAADARTKYWANRAMLVTAVSPNGLVDSLGTVYFGFALLADLCRVYNLRAGRAGTAVLLGRVFFNAYLAGNLADVEKLAEYQYDQLFAQGFQVVGVGVSTNVVGKFLGKVGAKATAGYLNRLLLIRLGRYGCRLLRPVEA